MGKSIEKLVEEAGIKIKQLTCWDPHLDSLKLKVIKREELFKEKSKEYEYAGISTKPHTLKGKFMAQLEKSFYPSIMAAQYLPFNETILVIPQNFAYSNESGLATILGHEIVHRCQAVNNPKFIETYEYIFKEFIGGSAFDKNNSKIAKKIKKYTQTFMMLVEGDASFVEGQMKKIFYTDAKIIQSQESILIGLLYLLFSLGMGDISIIKKGMQYGKGREIVGNIYEKEGRKGVNDLYNLTLGELYDKFNKN